MPGRVRCDQSPVGLFPAMLIACLKKKRMFMLCSLVMLMVLCLHCKEVGAIRVLFEAEGPSHQQNPKVEEEQSRMKSEELLKKYFNGKGYGFTRNGDKGITEDSKRRVPSCPDPLHNK